ncbi:XdhC family protein [Simiduia sp. 21SJ11W-1]|uniref:XdhC family protein n=1 Tax=Simiduia sp. 21SJ11W-1 TaxID=2909669 RepID=UPI00209E265A|nr:XdhC/CoxI family protein [Simiduia sp. 21SJ11W-1]UTA46777.1 XdhC family protein [Simiduia sp. 21SJ11W-1]
MNNHIEAVLAAWYPKRESQRWVLGVVTHTEGSSYRKPGAMMLISELGQCLGLLSGGCLERALLNEAKRVLAFGRPRDITFDATETADDAWQYGLGCGGRVQIRLLPLNAANQWLQLATLYQQLASGRAAWLTLPLAPEPDAQAQLHTEPPLDGAREAFVQGLHLWVPVAPQVRLVVFGAGVDVVPVVQLAAGLGWQITLVDHRQGLARPEDFPSARWLQAQAHDAEVKACVAEADAALVMTHNLTLDAGALTALYDSTVRYIGLLGPAHRKARLLAEFNLEPRRLPVAIDGPMGEPLGGDLPEAVALSALAACHKALYGQSQVAANRATHTAAQGAALSQLGRVQ